jgi:hypothetical protein
LSQHSVFANLIKDVGNTNLTFTKLIQKKKDSFLQLKNFKKIPRSLRIKCKLTASPPYTSHNKFQLLKEQLQDAVSEFIEKGTAIMTEWSETNIHLLIIDRCSNILTNALTILDGIASYNMDLLGDPNLPASNPNTLNLMLLQFYLLNSFGSAEDITSYLELPINDILILAAKIITNNSSDDIATKLLLNSAISNLETDNTTQNEFIMETLMQFDQIMRTTTIDIWKHHNRKIMQETAANNLKAKIAAFETIRATAATAAAITKATENLQETESRNIQDNLRITNLDKSLKRQENKTNELTNTLNRNNKNKTENVKRKNSQGSQLLEPMASPYNMAPRPTTVNSVSHLVDLTSEDEILSQNPDSLITSPPYTTKTSKRLKK